MERDYVMQAKEGKKYPLPEEYYNILTKLSEIKLIIMGKDPYPDAPTGIPFCKDTWAQMFQNNCSGRYVLSALGYESKKSLERKYSRPTDFFKYLAEKKGIVFLNISYHYIGGSLLKKDHEGYINDAWDTNKFIMQKAKSVVVCGIAGRRPWITSKWKALTEIEVIGVVHPDIRCKNSKYKSVQEEWKMRWGAKSSLCSLYNDSSSI